MQSKAQIKAELDAVLAGEKKIADEQEGMVQMWLLFFTAAAFRMPVMPYALMPHGDGSRLWVRARYKVPNAAMKDGEEDAVRDLVMHNVPGFNFSPASGIELPEEGQKTFTPDGEWPPESAMAKAHAMDAEIRAKLKAAKPVIQVAGAAALTSPATERLASTRRKLVSK